MHKSFRYLAFLSLVFLCVPEYVSADDYQSKSNEVNYYVIISEIGDYSGTLTLLKTYRKLTPDGYYVYAIQDELDKETWMAFVSYLDWIVLGYAYRDEVAGEAEIIDAEEFFYYISKIKIEN